MSASLTWSLRVTGLGLVLLFVLSQIDETLGAWIGWTTIVCGSVAVPLFGWLYSRRRGSAPGQDDPR